MMRFDHRDPDYFYHYHRPRNRFLEAMKVIGMAVGFIGMLYGLSALLVLLAAWGDVLP